MRKPPSCPRLSRASTPWHQSKAWMAGTSPAMTTFDSVPVKRPQATENMPQASKQTISVAGEQAGQRLDRVLAQAFASQASAVQALALSRTRLKALILDGAVSIGARTIRDPRYRVNVGETVTVAVPEPEPADPGG